MSKRDEYIEKMKSQLDRWNEEISKWEVKSQQAQVEVRTEIDKRLLTLREHGDQAKYQLHLLQAATEDAWTDLARGADDAWARMRETFDKAASHFREK